MTTLKQTEANRRNAALSTGPGTSTGKAVARMNALSHGLRAASPVVPGEDSAAWEAYREVMLSDLAPIGLLETELADRVASLSWRLRRVTGFEAGAVARNSDKAARKARGDDPLDDRLGLSDPGTGTPKNVQLFLDRLAWAERAEQSAARLSQLLAGMSGVGDDTAVSGEDAVFVLRRLPEYLPQTDDDDDFDDDFDLDDDSPVELDPATDLRHKRFLLALGVPAELHDEPAMWCGWTAGVVRVGVKRMAKSANWSAERLLEVAARGAAAGIAERRTEAETLQKQVEGVRRLTADSEAAARQRSLVAVEVTDTVIKYEGHLQRQLTQTLHELERRQALRSDLPPQPPAVLDLTVYSADGVVLPALGG